MIYRRIVCALFFAAALVLASLRGGDIVYITLRMAIFVPVASIAYTFYVYNNLTLFQTIQERTIIREEPVQMHMELHNETANISPVIDVKFHKNAELPELSRGIKTRLVGHEKKIIDSPVICHRRGKYQIGARKIVVTDLLGIMRISYPVQENYAVTVCPKIVQINSLSIFSLEGSREVPLQFGTDMLLDNAVRDYVPGDDPRRIHWKSTARTGTLKTRETTYPVRPQLYVLMQMAPLTGEFAAELEDNMIEAAIALANYSYRRSTGAVCLYAPTGQPEMSMVDSKSSFDGFYDVCCDIEFKGTPAMGKLFALADEAACCAVIASRVDDRILGSLRMMNANGTQCALILATDKDEEVEHYKDILEPAGIGFRAITPGCKLTDVLW